MSEAGIDSDRILAYIAEEVSDDGNLALLDAMRRCECSAEWIVTDFGVDYWKLVITVPRADFRLLKPTLQATEQLLLGKAQEATRCYSTDYVRAVSIVSELPASDAWRDGSAQPVAVTPAEADKLWKPGLLRAFVCHKDDERKRLAVVGKRLYDFGIGCFLAHQAIAPTKKWRDTIFLGLQSCDAVVAVSTPGFHQSPYCLQEVGWGLARGVVVLPVLAGEEPRGFYAEHQGPAVDLGDANTSAERIAKALCVDARTKPLVFRGMAVRFRSAKVPSAVANLCLPLEKLGGCPPALVDEIEAAFESNPAAQQSYVAVPRVAKWIERQRERA